MEGYFGMAWVLVRNYNLDGDQPRSKKEMQAWAELS